MRAIVFLLLAAVASVLATPKFEVDPATERLVPVFEGKPSDLITARRLSADNEAHLKNMGTLRAKRVAQNKDTSKLDKTILAVVSGELDMAAEIAASDELYNKQAFLKKQRREEKKKQKAAKSATDATSSSTTAPPEAVTPKTATSSAVSAAASEMTIQQIPHNGTHYNGYALPRPYEYPWNTYPYCVPETIPLTLTGVDGYWCAPTCDLDFKSSGAIEVTVPCIQPDDPAAGTAYCQFTFLGFYYCGILCYDDSDCGSTGQYGKCRDYGYMQYEYGYGTCTSTWDDHDDEEDDDWGNP